jgi:ACS family glucarate transporter-like MFS transporter
MSTRAIASARPVAWVRRSVRWHILALLFLISLLAYVYRQSLSIAGLDIRTEFGLTDDQLGWVISANIWGYAMFQLPGGLFGQVVGPRLAMTAMVLAWTALTFLCGVLPGTILASATATLAGLVLLRFVMGATQGPLFPVVGGTVAAWFPASRWAFPNALSTAGLNLGAAAAGPLIAWLMITFGWRASFYLMAPLGLAVAAFWWWYGRDDPSQHPRVEAEELALIREDRPPQSEKLPPGLTRRLLANRDILLLTMSYLCMNIVFYIFFSWFFIYLVDVRGFDALEGGFLAALPWVVASVGAASGGEIADRLCKRIGPRWGCRLPAIAGLLTVAVLLYFGAAAPNAYLAVTLLSLCLAGSQFTDGAYWEATTFVGGRFATAACGVLNTGGNVAGILATPMIPILERRFGWMVALSSGSVFAILAAILWLFVRADRPLEPGRET